MEETDIEEISDRLKMKVKSSRLITTNCLN